MLSFGFARTHGAARRAGFVGAAFALSLVTSAASSSARAQQIRVDGCVGSWLAANCATLWAPAADPFIRLVPQPAGTAAKARAKERERRWADRCRPTIVHDRYGVARYVYAMPGCEFGVGAN